MQDSSSDALVFFGATGDLAYKKIFPALQAMVKRGTLKVPVVGVAKSGWTLEQLKERARDSLEKHGGGVDREQLAHPVEQLFEQILDVKVRQRLVTDRLDAPQPLIDGRSGRR